MKNGPPPGPTNPPLVLNLSLGWDAQYGTLSNHRSGTLSFTYKQTDGRSASLTSAITVEP